MQDEDTQAQVTVYEINVQGFRTEVILAYSCWNLSLLCLHREGLSDHECHH